MGDLIYTFGGKDPDDSTATEIYDIAADRWFVDAPMPVGKAWLSACAAGDRLFAMGGAHGCRSDHDSHHERLIGCGVRKTGCSGRCGCTCCQIRQGAAQRPRGQEREEEAEGEFEAGGCTGSP